MDDDHDITLKRCHRCHQELPRNEFCVDRRKADGLYIWCRECRIKDRQIRNAPRKAERTRREIAALNALNDGMKICRACAQPRPLEAFGRDSKTRDGLRAICKACRNIRIQLSPTRGQQVERQRAYYRLNRERSMACSRAWRTANPDAYRECRARRRAQKIAGALVEDVKRQVVWERDAGRCYLCGKKANPNDWHLEHIVPLSRGGEHSYRNVAVSHPACNYRKGTRGAGQPRLFDTSGKP